MGDLLCLFTGVRAGVNSKRHIGSIRDLSILMRCRRMRILLRWLLCDGIICGPLHAVEDEDPAEVRSTNRPCTLDICNTARSFTHESNACVIRRWASLILGCIDLLSCNPPPATLLDHLWAGTGSWYSPRTQDVVKCKKTSYRFGALQFVCAHRRACATTPQPALLFSRIRLTLHLCCQMSLPWQTAPPPSYRNASKPARGPWLA